MNLIPTNIIKNMDLPNIKINTLRNILALVLITILIIFSPFYLFYIKPTIVREGMSYDSTKKLSNNWEKWSQGTRRTGMVVIYVGSSSKNKKKVRITNIPSKHIVAMNWKRWNPPKSKTWGNAKGHKDRFNLKIVAQDNNNAILEVQRTDHSGGWGMGLSVPVYMVYRSKKNYTNIFDKAVSAVKNTSKKGNKTIYVDVRGWKQNQKNSFKFPAIPSHQQHPLIVKIKNRRLPISFTSNSGSISRNGRSQYFKGHTRWRRKNRQNNWEYYSIPDMFRIDKINENEFHVYRTDGSNKDCKTNCRNTRWGQYDFKLEVVYGTLYNKTTRIIDVTKKESWAQTPWKENAVNTIVIGNVSKSSIHPTTIKLRNLNRNLPVTFLTSSGNITADKKTQYFKDGNDNFKIIKKSPFRFEVYRTDRGQVRWNQNLKLKVAYGTIPVKAPPHTHDFPSKSYVMAQDAKRASTELKERNKLRAEYQKYPGLWKSMVDKTSTDIRTAFNKEIQDKARFASEQRNLIRSEYRPKISKLEGEAKDDRANLTSKLAAYDKKIDGLGKKYLKAYIPDNKDYHFQYFKDSPDSYEPTPQEIKDFTSSKLYKDYATWYGFNKDYYNLKPSDIQNITKIIAHETIKAHEGIHLAAKKHGFFPYGEKTVTSTGGMNGPWWAPRITGVEDKDKDR